MTSGYRSGGVDFDDLFDPYVTGTKPAPTGRRVDGVDLSERYAPIMYGSKRADVGYRVDGVDVSNLWAAKGTASYFPTTINAYSESFTGQSRNAASRIWARPSGVIQVQNTATTSSAGAGEYPMPGAASDYQFRISGTVNGIRNSGASASITGKGGVSYTAAIGGSAGSLDTSWQDADDSNELIVMSCSSPANAGGAQLAGSLQVQVRRKSDNVVVSTSNSSFDIISDSQS